MGFDLLFLAPLILGLAGLASISPAAFAILNAIFSLILPIRPATSFSASLWRFVELQPFGANRFLVQISSILTRSINICL